MTALDHLQRLASVAQVGGFRPPSTPRSSWIGAVLLAAPDEKWPEGLSPVCQILVEELPAAVPAPLERVALLTLFVDVADMQRWKLRTYGSTDGLVPVTGPDSPIKPFPLLWRPRTELPSRDETPFDLLGDWDELEEEDPDRFELDGLKVGGWPATIQSELTWDAEFVLQVDSDEKAGLYIGDSGTLYVGWSADGWQLDWQSY